MLAKEREVQNIEDKAAEELKLNQAQEPETQNVKKYSTYLTQVHKRILNNFWQRSFKVISAEIIDLIKNKNDEARPFSIKETEYDFVDPCPEEMKQVNVIQI